MPLSLDDVRSIEAVDHYTHDDDQCYLMLYGEGVFETIPIEADYTVGDVKLWIGHHKGKAPHEYDLVGPKGVWQMGAGSHVLRDDEVIADVMGARFVHKWHMQLSLFPRGETTQFEPVEAWVPPPPEEEEDDDDLRAESGA